MDVFSSGRKVVVFFEVFVSCVHLTAMWNDVKGAFLSLSLVSVKGLLEF